MQEIWFEFVKINIPVHHKGFLVLCPVHHHYETVSEQLIFDRPLSFLTILWFFCKNTFKDFENEEGNSCTHV